MSGNFQNFSSHHTTEELRAVLTKKFIFLYEISVAPTYMGEMSTPTTHWRCECGLNRESENFFSHLTTEDEFFVWPKIRAVSFPLPISENAPESNPLEIEFFLTT